MVVEACLRLRGLWVVLQTLAVVSDQLAWVPVEEQEVVEKVVEEFTLRSSLKLDRRVDPMLLGAVRVRTWASGRRIRLGGALHRLSGAAMKIGHGLTAGQAGRAMTTMSAMRTGIGRRPMIHGMRGIEIDKVNLGENLTGTIMDEGTGTVIEVFMKTQCNRDEMIQHRPPRCQQPET